MVFVLCECVVFLHFVQCTCIQVFLHWSRASCSLGMGKFAIFCLFFFQHTLYDESTWRVLEDTWRWCAWLNRIPRSKPVFQSPLLPIGCTMVCELVLKLAIAALHYHLWKVLFFYHSLLLRLILHREVHEHVFRQLLRLCGYCSCHKISSARELVGESAPYARNRCKCCPLHSFSYVCFGWLKTVLIT